MDFCKFCSNIVQVNSFCKCRFSSCYLPLTKVNATQPQNVPDVEELTQAPAPGKAISGSTIQQTNKQTNKETNKQTNKQTNKHIAKGNVFYFNDDYDHK